MRQGEVDLTKAFKRGLRRFAVSPRNADWLLECHNWAPAEDGLEAHEEVTSLGVDGVSWDGQGYYTPGSVTRTITIRVTDYVDSAELADVTVFLDSVNKGTTDANGELDVADVSVGGHELKLTKAGYLDSDADDLFNDYIMVI